LKQHQSYFHQVLKPKLLFILMWLGLQVVYYTLFRALFIGDFVSINIWTNGLRFDLSSIFLLNTIFFIIILLPIDLKRILNPLKYCLLGSNAIFWALNLVDIPFYPFTQKRLQADVFQFFTGAKQTDIANLLPIMLKDNYIYFIIWFILVGIAYKLLKRTSFSHQIMKRDTILGFGVFLLIFLAISILTIRGGLQLRPINPIQAANNVDIDDAPKVLNTTFTILHSIGRKELPATDPKVFELLPAHQKGIRMASQDVINMSGSNVVVIIIESLSWEYLNNFGGTGATPFLDSLMEYSMLYTRAYANARESVQGIPAILASIPAWHDEAFIFSKYNTTPFNSLASLLKSEGYTSSFVHGATRGSMGFESFAKLAKFDQYHGREDYGNDLHYDGSWGIWDHHMLDYTKRMLDTIQKPFFTSYFTLNPHHPFIIPEPWNTTFLQDKKHPVLRSLKYIDSSLKQFFTKAKNSSWYDNTLFVITADHIGPITSIFHTKADDYHVPLILFHPSHPDFKGLDHKVVSQIDIMPSVLDLLKYPKPFFSIGSSIFSHEEASPYNLNYRENTILYIDSTNYGVWNTDQCLAWHQLSKTGMLLPNKAKDPMISKKLNLTQQKFDKSLQLYYHTMSIGLMNVKNN